jgi:hypothetical protein
VLHEVLDSNFKLSVFAVNGLIKGEIEKSSELRFVSCATKPMQGGWHRTRIRSSGLFCVKASLTMFFQFGLKIGGDATTGSARDTIVKVASESS